MTIERRLSPEEEELRAKQDELDGLLDQLTRKELDLQTLRGEVDAFFRVYNLAVLPRLVEAKRLRQRIAQAIYALHPNQSNRAESRDARAQAEEAARDQQGQSDARGDGQTPQPEKFTPSPALRALYINLVKQAHPDLARDEDDQRRRNEFMVRVNRAYQEGDEAALRALADEWAGSGSSPGEESIGEQLVRVIRQIADVRRRMNEIDSEIGEVKNSDDYSLVMQAEEAKSDGRDLVAEHVARLDEHIQELSSKIDDISDQLNAIYQG